MVPYIFVGRFTVSPNNLNKQKCNNYMCDVQNRLEGVNVTIKPYYLFQSKNNFFLATDFFLTGPEFFLRLWRRADDVCRFNYGVKDQGICYLREI